MGQGTGKPRESWFSRDKAILGVALAIVALAALAFDRVINKGTALSWNDLRDALGGVIAVSATLFASLGTLNEWIYKKARARASRARDAAVQSILADAPKARSLDPERASRLQEAAIALHTERLQEELGRLRSRALVAFVPGVGLCLGSLIAPYVSWRLATEQQGQWEYFIGGSTLAAILLGAGTALLRHDNKVREQVQWFQTEVLYFSRVRAGLDCALAIGADEHRKGLRTVIEHLLAPPPLLGFKSEADPDRAGRRSNGSDEAGDQDPTRALKTAVDALMKKLGNEPRGEGHDLP